MLLGPRSWEKKDAPNPWDDEAPETTAVPFPPNCCWSSRWRSSWTWPATICYPCKNTRKHMLLTKYCKQNECLSEGHEILLHEEDAERIPLCTSAMKTKVDLPRLMDLEPRNRWPNSADQTWLGTPGTRWTCHDGKIIYRWGDVPFPCLITEWRLGCGLYIFGFISVMSVWEENLWASQMQSFTYSRRVVENGM